MAGIDAPGVAGSATSISRLPRNRPYAVRFGEEVARVRRRARRRSSRSRVYRDRQIAPASTPRSWSWAGPPAGRQVHWPSNPARYRLRSRSRLEVDVLGGKTLGAGSWARVYRPGTRQQAPGRAAPHPPAPTGQIPALRLCTLVGHDAPDRAQDAHAGPRQVRRAVSGLPFATLLLAQRGRSSWGCSSAPRACRTSHSRTCG